MLASRRLPPPSLLALLALGYVLSELFSGQQRTIRERVLGRYTPLSSVRTRDSAGKVGGMKYPTNRRQNCPMAAKGFGGSDEVQPSTGGRSARKERRDAVKGAKKEQQKSLKQRKVLDQAREKAKAIVSEIDTDSDSSTDFFWKIIPALLDTEFKRSEISRVHDFIKISSGEESLPEEVLKDTRRPNDNLHAYFPGIEAPSPFRDPSAFPFVAEITSNIAAIEEEFRSLVRANATRAQFRSVTSMNYKNGWKTLPLYYNGNTIQGFPYDLCPVTADILSRVPVAGRIAGFNRQSPESGIPRHTDGNNMWLTCQLVYDTTFPHETFNSATDEDRVVLHIDFWNFNALSKVEIAALQRLYEHRQKYLEAEGIPQSL